MEAACDQQLFGDWFALRPAPSDTQPERERKRAELQRIREVFAQAAARGSAAQAAKRPSSPVAAPAAAQERQRRHGAGGRPPQPHRPALDTPLAALDECLTPINATTLLGPGLDGRRSTTRGGRACGRQPDVADAATALTAQGIKLGHPPDSAADFLPKRVAPVPAQPPQEPGSSGPLPPSQHPPQQQQPELAGQGLGRQGGRQWRAQPQIAKLVQVQKGQGRRSGRGSLGGSGGGSGSGLSSGGRSGGFPFAAPSDEGGLPFTGPAQPKPTRFGSTKEALAALMHSARSGGASGAGTSAGGAPGQPRGAQERGRQQTDWELESPVQDDSPFQLAPHAAGSRAHRSRSPDARAGPAATRPQPQQQRGQAQRERREALPLQPAGRHLPAAGTTGAREGGGEASPELPTEPLLRTAQSQRQAAQRPQQQQQQQHSQPQQPQQEADAAAQQGSEAAAQQRLLDEECTLPPPSGPAPIPFGSFTEQPGVGGWRLPEPAPQPAVQQEAVEQGEPAQQQSVRQPAQQQPVAVQQQQQQQQDEAIPDSQEDPLPSPPTVPRRLSPLLAPAAAAAEAGALTPPFPPHRPFPQQQPGAAAVQSAPHAQPQILQEAQHSVERAQHGGGAAAAGATPMWDSVPPTPAGLLDFSETAGDLVQGHSALNISLTALLDRGTLQLDMSPISPAERAAGATGHTAAGAAAEGASHAAAGGAGAWGDAAAGPGAGARQAEVPARPAQAACVAGSPHARALVRSEQPGQTRAEPGAAPLQQQHQEHQQQSCGWQAEQLPGARAASTRPPPAPTAAAAAAERAPAAAAPATLAAGQPPPQPLTVGTQLRLPQPALLAAASPDGRYAAVLLGSFAGYQPLEVLVLQLTDRPGGEPGAQCGWVQPVTSVAVRLCSEHPGWPLNANCLQVATDARGEPVLLLSASLELEDLPTMLRHAVPVISCAAGKPQLLMEIELPEPAWSLLWLGRRTLLTAGLGGVVQPVSVDFALRRYEWGRPLPVAVYHGFELLDLCRLSVAPGQPQLLAGVSSDGLLAVWDLRSRALLAAHTSHIYRIHHAQLLGWRQLEPGGGSLRSGGSGGGGGGGGPGHPGAAATLAPGPAGGSDAPLSFLAQLRPRDGGANASGGQAAPVLGAMSVTLERLTVGGTLQLPGLIAATVCDGLCLAGTQDGVLHVWDLASGQTQAVDGLDSQAVTCIADVSPQQAAAEEEGNSPSGSAEHGGEKELHGTAGAARAGAGAGGGGRAVLVTGAGGHCLLLDLPALREAWEG